MVGVPIKPRDFDFGDLGDFADAGTSLDGDGTFSIGGGDIGDGGFNIADSSFGGDLGGVGLSGIENIDLLPPIDTTAVASDNVYVEPPPQVVADVPTDPGLGVVNGDLIAVAPTSPDTNQLTPDSGLTISFDNNSPIPEFTPTDTGVIDSLENLNPADIVSSNSPPITPDPGTPVAVTPDPGAFSLLPGYTFSDFQPSEQGLMQLDALENALGDPSLTGNTGTPPTPVDGITIAGFVPAPDLGPDTALTPNPGVINPPVAFTPGDNVVASLPDITTPGVDIASTDDTSLGTGNNLPTLQQFKDQASQLANDPKLSSDERKTWQDVEQVAANLSPEDFGKLTLNDQFTTPVKIADGSTVPGDRIQDLTPQGQTAIRNSVYPPAYRTNNGINLGGIANIASQGFVQAGVRLLSLFGEKSILNNGGSQIYTVVQRVGVPVSVGVPITVRVGVRVPVTVVSTLPGGVVTRILVYQPNPVKTTAVTTATTKPKAPVNATVTPKPKTPSKSKREIKESDSDLEYFAKPEPKEQKPKNEDLQYFVEPKPKEQEPKNEDPEYFVEPEPKEQERPKELKNSYKGDVVFTPVGVPAREKEEPDQPKWDKTDIAFKYQPGDYPIREGGDTYLDKTEKSSYSKDEPSTRKGSGGSVEDMKPSPRT